MKRAAASTRSEDRALLLLATLALAACGKEPKPDPPPRPSAPASLSTAAPSASAAPTSWSLEYTLAAGKLYIPDSKDWANTKFKNDETKLLGKGALSLTVEPSGRVTGTSTGEPLGDAIVDGRAQGDAITGTVRRKDPADLGLTGTLVARVTGDKLEGAMKLAESNAAVVREASVTGTKSAEKK